MHRWLVLSLVFAVGCSDGDDGAKAVPDTELVETPDAVSNQTHVRILFGALGTANNFRCSLDGKVSPCLSPFEADVADGMHTFGVAAALNDNVDPTPATYQWEVDTVAPDTELTSVPPALDNSVSPTFAFQSPTDANATFECAIDEGAFSDCTSPHTVNSSDGLHSFQVRAKDRAKNLDPSPAIYGWTIDATAPDTTITSGPAANATTGPTGAFAFSSPDPGATFECATGASAFAPCTSPFTFTLGNGPQTFMVRAKDQVGIVDPTPAMRSWTVDAVGPAVTITSTPVDPTNVTAPAFAFTSEPGATFECQIDGVTTFAACTSPFTGAALADGTRTFRVRARDTFGNLGAPAAHTWTIDTVPPTVAFVSQPAAMSNDDTPVVTFTTGSGAIGTQCRVDAGTLAACSSPFTATAQADGAHTITVVARDAAGNTATITTAAFTIDTAAPTVTFTSVPAAVSNDTTPTAAFTTAGDPVTVQCAVDSGTFAACTSPFTPTITANGSHAIRVRVTDAATNTATFSTANFVIDTVPPIVTIVAQPIALSNNNDPSVGFTTGGGGMSPTCQLDGGTPVACTSPHAFANVSDGAHTITVRATDTAGNVGSATTSTFTVDTVGPALAFTEQAPSAWPVNYFDFAFTTGDAFLVQCALDAAAFATCASPAVTTFSYGVTHTFSVRGTDAAGNATTITSNPFTAVAGQVLHYPWEQGSTDNTSLLALRPSHSPGGPASGVPAFVGGWAGSALGNAVAAHTYAKTARVLSSSPNAHYTASFWIRARNDANGTIFSTATATNGLRVGISTIPGVGTTLSFTALEAGQQSQFATPIPVEEWVFVSLRTLGPATGLEVFINGMPRGSVQTLSGFVAAQADLVVGGWNLADVDDLRFYNRSFTNDEHCLLLGRGFKDGNGGCHVLAPGFEIDFEGRVADTGAWNLALGAPTGGFTFTSHTLGQLFQLTTQFPWGYAAGGPSFLANVLASPGRSLSFEFIPGPAFGQLIDMRAPCNPQTGGGGLCGVSITYPDNNQIQVYTGTPTEQKTTVVTVGLVANRFNNVVVTEQRNANGGTTSLTVYVNAKPTVIPVAGGDVFARVRDDVRFVVTPNLLVDEYEFWQMDLSKSAEILCENGFDSEFDVASGACLSTYGP